MKKSSFLLCFMLLSLFTSCKKDADRDQFIGTYDVTQACGGGSTSTYQVVISAFGEGETVSIGNLGNLGYEVKGTCSGNKLIFNEYIGVTPVDGLQVTFTIAGGEGTIESEKLVISFSFTATNGWGDTCTMSCIKK